ncbi:uncharacterized protein LOC116457480 isoform X1 [Hylobates moloch]|uniref:uncharacterized protein LOC116457480 isoform X1 n=1 Tax=Hylobates moloch TaxID=81572 RepID=UPI001363A891|nr:uncharacterized protein LOC116457480 isoform X1 [Hylobates moloch]
MERERRSLHRGSRPGTCASVNKVFRPHEAGLSTLISSLRSLRRSVIDWTVLTIQALFGLQKQRGSEGSSQRKLQPGLAVSPAPFHRLGSCSCWSWEPPADGLPLSAGSRPEKESSGHMWLSGGRETS